MATSEFQVTINGSGLNTSAPSDGFIDPTTVEQYRANVLTTGGTFGTVAAGQFVMINNFPVTLTGSTLAQTVIDINAQSAQHHAIASNNGGKLALINEPLYVSTVVSVSDGTPGITAQLGWNATTEAVVSQPTTLVQSTAKKRGNLRWTMLMARLGQTMTVNKVHAVVVTGGTLFSSDPTEIEFNVILDTDSPYAYDNSNNLVYGVAAVQAAIAMALTDSDTQVADIYDPTISGPNPPGVASGASAISVDVGALANNYSTALAAVTVTFVE